jgi:hypothetical protein
MKNFFCACAFVMSAVASSVRGGEVGEPTSVIVAQAPATVVVVEPRQDVVAMRTGVTGSQGSAGVQGPCANGRCGVARPYNVTESCTGSCRNRLMGGHVEKTTTRRIYRPARGR